MNKGDYIFTSDRLGFREWHDDDLDEFAKMNADEAVMEHFTHPLSIAEVEKLMEGLKKQFADNGYTYYATEVLETEEFIGMIGMAFQVYESKFTPSTDIGWRLKKSAWGKGYATEGAQRCIDYAFNELGLKEIFSICTINNSKSENVMKKIGMTKVGEFLHPKLKAYPDYEKHYCYQILNETK